MVITIQTQDTLKPRYLLHGVDSIDPRALPRILRIEGLIPFTLCAILLGFVVTLWEVGFSGANRSFAPILFITK